jgi:hypothetical protein
LSADKEARADDAVEEQVHEEEEGVQEVQKVEGDPDQAI